MANARRFLVTGALPYSNGRLHVGHIAGAYLPADIYVRYLRATGADVRFICGSDDNGVAALKSARDEAIPVEELTAKYSVSQKRSFDGLGITFDIYGGTHQPEYVSLHERISQEFFLKIHAKGYFTKKKTQQLYDVTAAQFLPDRYVQGKCPYCGYERAYGDQCENCNRSMDPLQLIDSISTMSGTRPERRETVHWYLRLDALQARLAEWLRGKQNPTDGSPPWRPIVLNQSLGVIEKEGLPERSMTRDMSWGVPVPLDDPDAAGKVLYVWFDAPIGYVSFTAALCERLGEGLQAYEHWWKQPDCKIVHFIGEDNIVFHAITWPAMLLATHESDSLQGLPGEFQLPHNVVSNSYLNIKFPGKDEEKISKSRGTAVWIEEYLQQFDPDPLRYYLTAVAPEQARTAFDFEDFINRNNTELLNVLGNFVNRTVTFTARYFESKVPPPGTRSPETIVQLERCKTAASKTAELLEACRFKAALAEMMDLARAGNVYFDAMAPWKQRRDDLAACGSTISACLNTVRTLTTLMHPFLPFSAAKCRQMLKLDDRAMAWETATWELRPGAALGDPVILFRKLDPTELFAA
jgi:methionyl-tRNA synthetase